MRFTVSSQDIVMSSHVFHCCFHIVINIGSRAIHLDIVVPGVLSPQL